MAASTIKRNPVVLHVRVVAGRTGGPDKTILRSAAHRHAQPFSVHAAYIHPVNDPVIDTVREQARQLGCPLWEFAERGPMDPRTVTGLLDLCRRLSVDIWHAHDHKSNALGLLLARMRPMHLVTTAHGWTFDTPRARLYQRVDDWCLPRYERVITVSPQLHEHCLRLGVKPERLCEIPNGVEIEKFRPAGDPSAARKTLGISERRPVIGFVGRLSVEKGVDRAITTLAALHASSLRAELHLIGDGPERQRLQTLANELGVKHAVRFWGWQTELTKFYQAMSMLILPSLTEGLPNVVLEAMAMGVPVAATDVGATARVLDHGQCGVILSSDVASWASQIKPLLGNPLLRASTARLARQRVESHYTFDRRVQAEAAVHCNLLGMTTHTHITTPHRVAA